MKPLYCDNHVAVFEKPHGYTTQIQNDPEKSLEFHAKAWIKKEFQKPGNVFLEPVHRLDKQVTGLVLFARTSKALSRLQASMRERKIKKRYLALISGKIEPESGSMRDTIVHDSHRARISKEGKEALLFYETLQTKDMHTLLGIDLQTGRYHQIRIQLSSRGHPIIGDEKYGSKERYKKDAIALQHAEISFPHPITKEITKVNAPTQLK